MDASNVADPGGYVRPCHLAGASFVDACFRYADAVRCASSGSDTRHAVQRPGCRMLKVCSTSSPCLSAFACVGLCLSKSSSYEVVRPSRIVMPQLPVVSDETFARWEQEGSFDGVVWRKAYCGCRVALPQPLNAGIFLLCSQSLSSCYSKLLPCFRQISASHAAHGSPLWLFLVPNIMLPVLVELGRVLEEAEHDYPPSRHVHVAEEACRELDAASRLRPEAMALAYSLLYADTSAKSHVDATCAESLNSMHVAVSRRSTTTRSAEEEGD